MLRATPLFFLVPVKKPTILTLPSISLPLTEEGREQRIRALIQEKVSFISPSQLEDLIELWLTYLFLGEEDTKLFFENLKRKIFTYCGEKFYSFVLSNTTLLHQTQYLQKHERSEIFTLTTSNYAD